MFFTLVYSTIGNPDSHLWSGLYFIANYLTLLCLFMQNKSSTVRKIGISLSISILIYVVLKFFFDVEYSRIYTLVPFLICIVGIFLIEKRQWKSKKNS